MEEHLSKKVFVKYLFLSPAFVSDACAFNEPAESCKAEFKSIYKNLLTSAIAVSDLQANLFIGDINHV